MAQTGFFSRIGRRNAKSKSQKKTSEESTTYDIDAKGLDAVLLQEQQAFRKHFKHMSWYHGDINRRNSETKLKSGKTGSFLVRQSNAVDGDFVLSLYVNGAFEHYLIEHQGNCMYTISNGKARYFGLDELILSHEKDKVELPSRLLYPVPKDLPPPLSLSKGLTNSLHTAIIKGDTNKALDILQSEYHPDVNLKDNNGCLPLHLSVMYRNEDVLHELVNMGANVEVVNTEGLTPLHLSAIHNRPKAIEILREFNVNVQHIISRSGNTALHEAAQRGHTDCVQKLLDLTVPAWPRNYDLKTPYELAQENNHPDVAKLLDAYVPPQAETQKDEWYHGKIDRNRASELLKEQSLMNGLFLVRDKTNTTDQYVLSVIYNNNIVKHYEINNMRDAAYFTDKGPMCRSLEHFVEHYCKYKDDLDGILTYSISKGGEVIEALPKEAEYYNSFGFPVINENGTTTYMEAAVKRKESVPSFPPPPLPVLKEIPKAKEPMVLDVHSIEMCHELGQGEYGAVYAGYWTTHSGERVAVAIKTMHEQNMNANKESFLQEAKVMVVLDHPCIVQLIGVCQGPPLMLVQEMLSLGSLLDYLLDYPEKINMKKDLYLWAGQIACGMLYLEKKGLVHRDLAARNILLESKSQAKVGDFGLSRAIGKDSDYYKASKGGRWPVKWYAPESVNFGTFSHKSDVWSFGVTLWEMFSLGNLPYPEKSGAEVISFLEKGGRLDRPAKCSKKAYELMRRCWEYEPGKRPQFKELFEICNEWCAKAGSFVLRFPSTQTDAAC